MFSKILGALGSSILITLIYTVAANISYYLFRGETMYANLHGYAWVEYVIAGGIILGAVFFSDLTRRLLTDGVRSVGYGVIVAFVYLAIAANVINIFFFKEMLFSSWAQYAITVGAFIVAIVVIEGIQRAAGKQNG